jgi:hypothetical protein
VNCREHTCKALAGFFLSLALGSCTFTGDGDATPAAGHDPDAEMADVVVPAEQAPEIAAGPTIPVIAAIKVYLQLDPHLTRGVSMGDRWVSPASFTTARQPGKQGTVEARAVALDDTGRLLNRRLEPDWLAVNSALVSVSPTRGNSVTITVQSPGESTLRVTDGDVVEILTIRADYDEQHDATQLVISRSAAELSPGL